MAEVFVAFIAMFFVALVCIAFLAIPIMIANARGICGGGHTGVVVLSILGIFFGLTGGVAVVLSLVWRGDCLGGDNLDKLDKLAKLYKDKVITKSEYERMKAKLLRE